MRSAVLRAGLAALAVSSTAAGGSSSTGLGVDRGGRQLFSRARGVLRPRRTTAMVGAPGGDEDATVRLSIAGAASARPAAAGIATSSSTMAQSTAQTISPGGSTVDFPPIFVVNLDRNPERWHQVLSECEREGVAAQRLPAVNGKALSQEEVAAGSTWLW